MLDSRSTLPHGEALQRFVKVLSVSQVDDVHPSTAAFVHDLADGAADADAMALCRLGLIAVGLAITRLHRGLPACSCGDVPAARVAAWLSASAPAAHLQRWLAEFGARFARRHPESPGEIAARLIRCRPKARWTVNGVSRDLGMNARRLSNDFRRMFAMPLEDYVHVRRLLDGFDSLRDPGTKIDPLGMELGYRGKGFYRVIPLVLGVTAGTLRRSRECEVERLRDDLMNRSLPIRLRRRGSAVR